MKGNIETKADDSFLVSNIVIDELSIPYRLDCDRSGGGKVLYDREDLLCSLRAKDEKSLIMIFYVELNLHNGNWLINLYRQFN